MFYDCPQHMKQVFEDAEPLAGNGLRPGAPRLTNWLNSITLAVINDLSFSQRDECTNLDGNAEKRKK